jgi:putative membrane protein
MRNRFLSMPASLLALVLALICLSHATAQTTQAGDPRTQNSGAQRIPQDGPPPAKDSSAADTATPSNITRRDQRYMWDLARANQTEIVASQLAETRAANPQVRQFAKQMVDDHTAALGKLNTLAQKKQVVLPQDPTKDQAKMPETLRVAPGPGFDKTYIDLAGNKAHEETLNLLKKIQASAQDGDLKLLAEELQPNVEAHLKMAREISGRDMRERR